MGVCVFFEGDNEFACFSNFFPSVIEIDGKQWSTVEHFFQAMKTTDTELQERVRLSPSPGQSKKEGRKLILRPDWEDIKFDIMMNALRVKFSIFQFKQILLSTGDRPIFEDSPYDAIWGTGILKGVGGKNLLGKALMQLREELKK